MFPESWCWDMVMMSGMQKSGTVWSCRYGSRSGTSGEDVIHEDTVSPVWGTPDMDSSLFQLKMPVVAISGPKGEYLIQKLEMPGKWTDPLVPIWTAR